MDTELTPAKYQSTTSAPKTPQRGPRTRPSDSRMPRASPRNASCVRAAPTMAIAAESPRAISRVCSPSRTGPLQLKARSASCSSVHDVS